MAFVNEFASDDDIEKYDLNGIWDKFHPLRKGKYYSGQRPAITINREKNIFLLKVGGGWEDEPSRSRFFLWIDGRKVVIDLDSVKSKSHNNNTHNRTWGFVNIYPDNNLELSNSEIIEILKEALAVYGMFGIYSEDVNVNVSVNFNF